MRSWTRRFTVFTAIAAVLSAALVVGCGSNDSGTAVPPNTGGPLPVPPSAGNSTGANTSNSMPVPPSAPGAAGASNSGGIPVPPSASAQ